MRRLFELRPWYKLIPDQAILVPDQGEGDDHVQAARAGDGSFLIAYLPRGHAVGIRMDKISGSDVMCRWFDPRGGTWRDLGKYPNTGVREFVAPSQGDQNDWALVLEDAGQDFPLEPEQAGPKPHKSGEGCGVIRRASDLLFGTDPYLAVH